MTPLSYGRDHTQILVFTALAVSLTQLTFDSAVSTTLLSHELSMFSAIWKTNISANLSPFGKIN
jgi:hypothetical protein